jgi:hypothetical protein
MDAITSGPEDELASGPAAGSGGTPPPAGTVDFTMMYVAHRAFARDPRRLRLAAEHGRARTPGATARWAIFTRQLLFHHEIEDAVLWPMLRDRPLAPREVDVVEAMGREHDEIDPLLEEVDDALAARGRDDRTRLVASIDALATHLTAHLRHEEDEALPLVESHLGLAGWEAFIAAIRKRQSLRGVAEYLPWLLEDTPQEIQAGVLGLLPPPVRFVYRRRWAPKYRRAVGSTP